jgi:transcription factor C subunit 7
LSPPIQRVYSSPFYRCIQTIAPTVALLNNDLSIDDEKEDHVKSSEAVQVRLENGVGEWYGTARFDHPSPATPSLLASLFPSGLIDTSYSPIIVPSTNGESIISLHDRTAYALHKIIQQCDEEGVEAICICTHAATLIAIGRVLVGRMPEKIEEEDFRPFTCGLTTFTRKSFTSEDVQQWSGKQDEIPKVNWRSGTGVGGGWDLGLSGDCSFLSGGEERGWRFSGDESFHSATDHAAGLDAGSGLGVVIEGKKNEIGRRSPSRL